MTIFSVWPIAEWLESLPSNPLPIAATSSTPSQINKIINPSYSTLPREAEHWIEDSGYIKCNDINSFIYSTK